MQTFFYKDQRASSPSPERVHRFKNFYCLTYWPTIAETIVSLLNGRKGNNEREIVRHC